MTGAGNHGDRIRFQDGYIDLFLMTATWRYCVPIFDKIQLANNLHVLAKEIHIAAY